MIIVTETCPQRNYTNDNNKYDLLKAFYIAKHDYRLHKSDVLL